MVLSSLLIAAALAAPHRHSMNEYAYLIGTWRCSATVPKRSKAIVYETSFQWKYPSHTVIDQSIATKRGSANFMLSYAAATDSFVGVFTGSDGSEGFWQNPGPQNGGWTEWGYDIADLNSPNTRATFYGITPTHYAFHFWSVKSKADPGKPIESDTCVKIAS